MTFALILLILGWCIAVCAIIADFTLNKETGLVGSSIIASCGTICIVVGIVLVENAKEPKAIDVYRGKTTLEITYRDSVAVDSVVVYKNN